MRYLSLIALVLIAAVSCTESGTLDPAGAEVLIDGTVFVAVTVTPESGGTVPVPTATPSAGASPLLWNRIAGSPIIDVPPKPIRTVLERTVTNLAFNAGVENATLHDLAYWDGMGSARWAIEGSAIRRAVLINADQLPALTGVRLSVSVVTATDTKTWSYPAHNPAIFTRPDLEQLEVVVNASPGTPWAITIAEWIPN